MAVPAFIRGEEAWDKQFDTSHHNLYTGNQLKDNGADVYWDGQGSANCWEGVRVASPAALPGCGATGPARVVAEPVKLVQMYLCNDYSIGERRLPGGCWWFGSSGLARVEVQLALGGSVVLALMAVLLWRRRLRSRWALPLTVVGLAGLALDVLGALDGYSVLPAAALALTGLWLLGAGWIMRGAFGWFTVVLGVLHLVDAFDRAVWMLPLIPIGPGWIRGLLTGVWVLCAVVVVAPRRRAEREEAAA